MRYKLFVFLLFLMPCSWLCAGQAVAIAQSPTEQLRPMVDRITAILKQQTSKPQDNELRVDQVMEVARKGFDFEEMSKRVLGSQWRSLSESEQGRFVEAFTELLKYAYVRQIDRYSGQEIEFVTQRIRGNRAEVKTLLLDRDKEIPVSYILKLKGEQWLVYDVVVEGVSLIRNYLEQFQDILRKEDFSGLMTQLNSKITELKQQNIKG